MSKKGQHTELYQHPCTTMGPIYSKIRRLILASARKWDREEREGGILGWEKAGERHSWGK